MSFREFLARCIDRLRRNRLEDELSEELRFHQSQLERDALNAGIPSHEAPYAARRQLGNATRVAEEARERWSLPAIENVLQDVRYAMRGLRRSPVFTVTVVITLALGIGVNTAMFGIIDRLMFRPYPYMRDPATVHLPYLLTSDRGRTMTQVGPSFYGRYLDFKRWTSSFSQWSAISTASLAVGTGADARERPVAMVSATFFSFFDMRPALGRFFVAAEDTTPRGADVSVISYEFWQTQFGGRDVLGEHLQVWNINTQIVGVAPKGFVGVFDAVPPEVYIPITTYAASSPNSRGNPTAYYKEYNWGGWMTAIARRKSGVSVAVASADLTQAYVKSWDAAVATDPGTTSTAIARPKGLIGPLKTAAGPDPTVEQRTVRWVSGVALIVLLIACTNVANLLLARALKRRRETAVRIALGVAHGRLIAQSMIESFLIAVMGCAAGVLLAQWGGVALRQLFVLQNGAPIPVSSDWRTIAISATLAIAAALLSGIVPALLAGRVGVAGALKAGARSTQHRSALRTGLIVFQVTMSTVLLVGAGLFVRSVAHLRTLHLGYDAEPVVLVTRNLRGAPMQGGVLIELHQKLLQTAQALPGVKHASLASSVPFLATASTTLTVPGIDSVARLGRFSFQAATSDYFRTIGTRILRGRAFDERDRAGSERVAVVSDAMAKVLWPGEDAIGKRMKVGLDATEFTTVIGICENTAQRLLDGDPGFRYYMPAAQYNTARAEFVFVQVAGDPAVVGVAIQKALQPLMPGQAYVTARPMRDIISNQQRSWRFGATMFVAFGGLALVVAAIGLYGVIGYSVTQRMHELAVRAALGAQRGDLIGLVMANAVRIAVAGIVVGCGLALAGSARLQPLLFRESARDPLVFAVVAAVLLGASLMAGFAPAIRAARADPNSALRSD